ncbi:MAG: single-stranded DNA-binding protein [Eubacteriales bacterium]
MNKAILVGNLTRDPEHRTTPNNLSVTTFAIAVQRRFTQGEQKADFFNIVTWRGLADNCAKYLQKGSKVGVVGALQTRQYDDKNGVRRYITEIVADEVEFLTAKGANTEYKEEGPRSNSQPSADDLFGDELSAFEPVDDAELPF